MILKLVRNGLAVFALALFCMLPLVAVAADGGLNWNTNSSRVSANIQSTGLPRLLEQIAAATGWKVFLEPGVNHTPSAKFKDLPTGEALRLLLGSLNFALVPQTNGPSRLYVFRTSQGNATQLIRPVSSERKSHVLANELVVRLKPGTNVEELARRLGAKITGRIDELNIYRLEFANEAAAQAAREALLDDPSVLGIDSNYSLSRPPAPDAWPAGSQAESRLKAKKSTGPCPPIIGLVDTPTASGGGLDPFLLPTISVAGNSSLANQELTHGTAMAQAIMQSIQTNTVGNQTAVKILPVDVYGPNQETSTFQVGQGIYQAINAGANIINLSLGGTGDSAFLHQLIANASQQGIVFFAAAGNEPVTTPFYPAAYPEVTAVTASDPSGRVADYANRGSFVSVMAPGTSLADFQGQTYLLNGTSSAAAFATGFAAALADGTQTCPNGIMSTVRSKWGVRF
jgi:hypothetical protein